MTANESHTSAHEQPRLTLAVGVFKNKDQANQLVARLIKEDFPSDRISVLHRSGGSGDDMLGISYSNAGERMKVWGEHGAFWGGLWGLLAGATGLFVLPGIGPLLAAGPIVEALGGAIAGAALTGGAMAGAAALTELAGALHRMGIPDDSLEEIHAAIEAGAYVVILHCAPEELTQCQMKLRWAGADPDYVFPVDL